MLHPLMLLTDKGNVVEIAWRVMVRGEHNGHFTQQLCAVIDHVEEVVKSTKSEQVLR
jgi:hypothetical protein